MNLCELTHKQLLFGPIQCPHCTDDPPSPRSWNLEQLKNDLHVFQGTELDVTLANICLFDLHYRAAIELFESTNQSDTRLRSLLSVVAILQFGTRLSKADMLAAMSDYNLSHHPELAIAILGNAFARRFIDKLLRDFHSKALLSLIEFFPRCCVHSLLEARFDSVLEEADFLRGKELWQLHVTEFPDDPLIWENAKSYGV